MSAAAAAPHAHPPGAADRLWLRRRCNTSILGLDAEQLSGSPLDMATRPSGRQPWGKSG
jgi:hypothetical protein